MVGYRLGILLLAVLSTTHSWVWPENLRSFTTGTPRHDHANGAPLSTTRHSAQGVDDGARDGGVRGGSRLLSSAEQFPETMQVYLEVYNQSMTLDLHLNTRLVHHAFVHRSSTGSGHRGLSALLQRLGTYLPRMEHVLVGTSTADSEDRLRIVWSKSPPIRVPSVGDTYPNVVGRTTRFKAESGFLV